MAAGKYTTSKGNTRQRWKCVHCNYNFIKRDITFKSAYPKYLIKKIIRLYKTKKGYINKYDRTKKTTYSSREISERTGIPKSTVFTRIILSKKYEKV